MNNPFQNFNTKYTPSPASLSFVLSKMEMEQAEQARSPMYIKNNIFDVETGIGARLKKSPLYTWTLAGGLSFVGMAAAFLFFFQSTNNLPIENREMAMSTPSINHNSKDKSIDDALVSVANFNDNNDLNKKF